MNTAFDLALKAGILFAMGALVAFVAGWDSAVDGFLWATVVAMGVRCALAFFCEE